MPRHVRWVEAVWPAAATVARDMAWPARRAMPQPQGLAWSGDAVPRWAAGAAGASHSWHGFDH